MTRWRPDSDGKISIIPQFVEMNLKSLRIGIGIEIGKSADKNTTWWHSK